ncbi:MAG TPA: endonuclease/exonuclease/phosphatase family protein [Allosphingosinicella sp.]|nr:endonuclease/exonuclease/phosphatase family protein [Allosphingosinicella sp.]
MRRLAAALGALALLGGCATLPRERTAACAGANRPAIALSEDGRTASTRLDVLTYNVEGLSWPARTGRAAPLRAISARLAELRASGAAPEVVFLQEVFSGNAVRAVEALPYPSIAAGPARSEDRVRRAGGSLPGPRRPFRGELGLKLQTAGLAIAADYPILTVNSAPFPRRSCAGFDCLANKGVLHAEIQIPGVPGTLHLFNTHMNSQGSSRVPARRHHAAHRQQAQFIASFIHDIAGFEAPLILGGDFNMRHSELRFDAFDRTQPLRLVHRVCAEQPETCDVGLSWDGDAPWMDTQDLQLFWPGDAVAVRPVRVEAMFDGGPSGPRLSDHDGFRVVYELSWLAELPGACAAPSGPAPLAGA